MIQAVWASEISAKSQILQGTSTQKQVQRQLMNHRESLKSVTLKICYSFLQQIGYIKSDH
jgi:3-methyladenine DNA glycosylase Tag